MSPKRTDLRARVGELEATVSGLTKELVEANERIRQLEAALNEADEPPADAEGGVSPDESANGDGGNTRQMGDDGQTDEEAGSDLDDIIVA